MLSKFDVKEEELRIIVLDRDLWPRTPSSFFAWQPSTCRDTLGKAFSGTAIIIA